MPGVLIERACVNLGQFLVMGDFMTRALSLALVAALAIWPAAASADAIDGDWCNADGKHFKIDGSTIELGSGNRITGNYSRHSFSYVGPEGDPDEGQQVQMILQSEHLLDVRRNSDAQLGPVEEWRRCSTVS